MNIEHTQLDDGSIHTTGTDAAGRTVNITTAPGILPPFSTKTVNEDAAWRVRPTWKGAQHSTGKEGGLQDRHQQPWRGWPSVKHRTMATTVKV